MKDDRNTVPVNKLLLAGTVPVNKLLLTGTLSNVRAGWPCLWVLAFCMYVLGMLYEAYKTLPLLKFEISPS